MGLEPIVITGVITLLNGLINGFHWGYNPYKWSHGPHKTIIHPQKNLPNLPTKSRFPLTTPNKKNIPQQQRTKSPTGNHIKNTSSTTIPSIFQGLETWEVTLGLVGRQGWLSTSDTKRHKPTIRGIDRSEPEQHDMDKINHPDLRSLSLQWKTHLDL